MYMLCPAVAPTNKPLRTPKKPTKYEIQKQEEERVLIGILCFALQSSILAVLVIALTCWIGYTIRSTSYSNFLLTMMVLLNVYNLVFLVAVQMLSCELPTTFVGTFVDKLCRPGLTGMWTAKPEWQKGGFVTGIGVVSLGAMLFLSKVVILEDVVSGAMLADPKTCPSSSSCYYFHADIAEAQSAAMQQIHSLRKQNAGRSFLQTTVAAGKSYISLANMEANTTASASCYAMNQNLHMKNLISGGHNIWPIPIKDFTCEDIAREDPDNLKHPSNLANNSAPMPSSQCLYICTSFRTFVPSDYIMDIGMIVGGGAFLAVLITAIVDLPGIKFASAATTAEEMKYILHEHKNINTGMIALMRASLSVRASFSMRACMLLQLVLLLICYMVIKKLQTSLVDIFICINIFLLSLLSLKTRMKALCTEPLFKTGTDEFVEVYLENGKTRVPFQHRFGLYEWMQLPKNQQARKLITLAKTPSQTDIIKNGPLQVRAVAQTEVVEMQDKKINMETGDLQTVTVKHVHTITKGQEGVATKMIGNAVTVKWPGIEQEVVIDVSYLTEAGDDWKEVEVLAEQLFGPNAHLYDEFGYGDNGWGASLWPDQDGIQGQISERLSVTECSEQEIR